ncbi:hypothetical protein CCDG5_1492 [[Clostridium] cellulosi]|uniref:Protein translocase subunit SecE n=1 Tax=[Clostridium] cellulosi TaxID=29343 RepID=A0A078KPZ3_9FIRM|nr:MAG: preprotein translocase subunit SecE [[Clostridium] cellulosi]CDZ24602.1 hypothetical protein CCDG5_1492 [[Clostridium] cellulosi]
MPDIEAKVKGKSVAKNKAGKKRTEGLKRYFTETKAEFKKIIWPTPKETFKQTAIVFLAILIFGVFIWALDSLAMSVFYNLLQKY